VRELQAGQRVFEAFLPAKGNSVPTVAPGTKVRVTGVCQVEADPVHRAGRRVASFKTTGGVAGDLVILQRPAWWTLKRALLAAGTFAGGNWRSAAGWIGILRRQVEERTKQLQQEIAEHEKTEARLAEETAARTGGNPGTHANGGGGGKRP